MEKFPALINALRDHAILAPWSPAYVSDDIRREGNKAAHVLDHLTVFQKTAYVLEYQKNTGFPNMELTASVITDHFRKAIIGGTATTRAEIVFAGYDPTCSVARNRALPGSDVDFLTVVVRNGNSDFASKLYAEVVGRLEPAIADLRSLTPYSIIDFDRLIAYRPEFLASNGRYIMFAGLPWSGRLIDHEVATETISQIQSGVVLVDNLPVDIKESFEGKRVYNFVRRHSINTDKEKSKYKERVRLCEEFPGFSIEEQFAIIRVLQNLNEGISINLRISDNPYGQVLNDLVDKGILRYKSYSETDEVVVPWEHDSENARVLRPANWHPREGIKVMSKWS